MYDFQVFGYYAAAIASTFFPSGNEFLSLMASLATFGAGFLMRPLGAILLGSYIDHRGRRAGLLLTLGLMAIGTFSIACTPSYASIGLIAPLLVVAGRLVQGLSAGVEIGGASIYLAEVATPGRKGFFVALQTGSQQIGVMFTAALGLYLTTRLTPAQMTQWGWRVPLLVGCAIIPLVFVLRGTLQETPAFLERKHRPAPREILRILARNWPAVVRGIMLVTMTTVTFYMITTYTPTFGSSVLHLAPKDNMIVTLCVGASNLTWVLVAGALSDRIGRRPILITVTSLALVTVYPAFLWLVGAPTFLRLMTVGLWFSFLFGAYNGAMLAFLAEIVPLEARATAFSLSYGCAAALGGFSPAISTYLIHATGNRAVPGLWMSFAAACGLIATLITKPRQFAD
jgi:MFS family permease